MSDQIPAEYADLELADLESAVSRIQLHGQGAVTRKPTVTVLRDVAELAPTANASISAQLSRGATRPLAHTVRRLVQCELDVYAHLLDHASSAVRRDAGAALTDAKNLLLSVRSLLSAPRDASAQAAVKSAASRVAVWLARVHDEQLLGHESDVTGTHSVLLSPRADAGQAREQTAFLERERAKNQLQQQQLRSGGASIVAAVVDDVGASSVSAQQEEARLQRALQRKTAGGPRDPKRKTWGANALANAYDTANGGSTNSSNNTTPTATPTATPSHPRTPPVAAQEHHPSPHAASLVRVVPASPLAPPVAAGGKSSTTDAEEARLQRSMNRSSYRGTWSPAKAAATTTASAPSTPSHAIHDALAGVSSPTTRVEDISRTVAQVARVVSPRTSYTAQPNQTPPPRMSATRGDADRFNASLDSLTRALGASPHAASPHVSSPSASELQRQADRRASYERERVAAEEAQAKVAADLVRDEQAYERARKHAQDLRERAEQEAKAMVAAREKADAEERAARQARRDADVAAERERARAKLEERSAAVAAEKERSAAQRAAEESRREEARREEARREEARVEAARRENEQRTQQLQHRQHPSTAKSVLHSVQKQDSHGRARAGTVEKVLKSTVKELTADDDDDDNNVNTNTTTTTTTSTSIVRIDSDRAKWDGIGDAMSGLVDELDELAVVTSAAGTPIVSSSKTTTTTTSSSTQSAHEQLEAERAALARERARLDEERRLLDEERERSRQIFGSELERERKALERERQELARLKAQQQDSVLDVLISDLRSFPISSTPAQREESVRSHKVRVTLNDLEREFVQELHALRRAPRSYAALLRDSRVPFFVGRQLNLTRSNGQRVALASAEGVAPVLEAIEILERTKPLDDVRVYDGLTFAARDAVARNSTQPDALERILEYGRAEGKMRQNAWIGTLPALTASDIVMAMLISDGDPQRRQRVALLAPETTSVGVCAGHATHFATDGNYMVLVLCEHFDE